MSQHVSEEATHGSGSKSMAKERDLAPREIGHTQSRFASVVLDHAEAWWEKRDDSRFGTACPGNWDNVALYRTYPEARRLSMDRQSMCAGPSENLRTIGVRRIASSPPQKETTTLGAAPRWRIERHLVIH